MQPPSSSTRLPRGRCRFASVRSGSSYVSTKNFPRIRRVVCSIGIANAMPSVRYSA
jgi:hypothetical protein